MIILWAISLGLSSYLMILRVLSRSCVISLSEANLEYFVQTQDQSKSLHYMHWTRSITKI